MTMAIKAYVLLTIITVAISLPLSQTDKTGQIANTCSLGYNQHEWQQQSQQNKLHLAKAKQTFKTPSQLLLYKLFRYKYNFKHDYQTFQLQTNKQIQTYSNIFKYSLYLLPIVLILWIVRFIRKYIALQFKRFNFMDSKIFNLILQVILFACIFGALLLSIYGFNEGKKSQKTAASLICNIYLGPIKIIKGGQGAQYDGLDNYIKHVDKYLYKFSQGFQSLQHIFAKQYVLREMIFFGRQMIDQQDVDSSQFYRSMNKTITTLQSVDQIIPKIQKALKWFNKTLQYSKQLAVMAGVGLASVQRYSNQHLKFTTIIKSIGFIIKAFYAFIFLLTGLFIFTIASIFWKKQSKFRISNRIMQCLLIMPIITCLGTAYLNSLVVPGIIWSNSIVDYLSRGELYVRNQFNLPLKVRADLVQLLTHLIPINATDYTQMYYGHLMKNISQYEQIVQSYSQVNSNYFDSLFRKGLQLSKQSKSIDIRRVNYLIKNNLIRDILVNFQNAKEGVREILSTIEQKGELAIINPSAFGVYFREMYKVIKTPLFNRIYNGRWICGRIGIMLLISLVCLTLIKNKEKSQGRQYKQFFHNEQKSQQELQMFTNDSIN